MKKLKYYLVMLIFMKQNSKRKKIFFKKELNKILSFYGMRVASGDWKDYAIDRDKDKSSFSI
ncbi:MAG: hypothetical protein CM15mP109_04130 [Candidatus Dadabacteria bacterium]|nr:MAG: hypothetical protein CM15mP109_04130 [Candidatus Dadabacteria bacterium]